jgi:hypothetical protein
MTGCKLIVTHLLVRVYTEYPVGVLKKTIVTQFIIDIQADEYYAGQAYC